DRASRLVADLLDQSAARPGRARHDLQCLEARALSAAPAPARPDRRAADDAGCGGAAAGAVVGRAPVRLDLAAVRRAAFGIGGAVGPVRLAAGDDGRAVFAARRARQSGGALRGAG